MAGQPDHRLVPPRSQARRSCGAHARRPRPALPYSPFTFSMTRRRGDGAWAARRAGGCMAVSKRSTGDLAASRREALVYGEGAAPEVLAASASMRPARTAVYATRGYEPWEPEARSAPSSAFAGRATSSFGCSAAGLLFEPDAIATGSGRPFRVFTPFWKACLAAPAPRRPLPAPQARALRRRQRRDARHLEAAARPSPIGRQACAPQWQPGEQRGARAGSHHFIAERPRPLCRRPRQSRRRHAPRGSRPICISASSARNQVWHAVSHAADERARQDGSRRPALSCASSAGASSPIICCTISRR